MKVDKEVPGLKPRERAEPPSGRRALFNRPVVITALVTGALLAGLIFFKLVVQPQIIKGILSKNVPPPATVGTEVARTEAVTARLPSVGTLTAIQGIDVTSQVPGIVAKIYFESGAEVKAGDKLLDLDTLVETADLANGEATLRQADADLARQNDLLKRAIAAEATQQAAQAKRDSAAAAVAKSKALIAQKHIVAPFTGRIGIRKVDLGQYVAPGAVLTSLQQLDPVRVDFPVPESELARLKIGQVIELTVAAYPDATFSGVIKSLDARVAADTRTLLVRAEVANPDHRLLPGMFAKLDVVVGAPHDEVTVPRTAITYSLYGDSVYVVHPAAETTPDDLVAERRFVRTGEVHGDRVSVSEGLKPGEQVVTIGQLKLQPGGHVRIDNTQPLTPPTVRPRL